MAAAKDRDRWFTLAANGFIVAIALLSFRAFAAYLNPGLNSDHAVHVLMADDLKLPNDLYYWGQDRLGSLVPILGHLLLQIFPVSPVQAVSYVQYFFLGVGFFCFASLLKRPLSRAILALIWFLPLNYFAELLNIGQPYGAQLGLIAIAIVLIQQLMRRGQQGWRRQALIGAAAACLFVSLWVSDFTIVTLLLIGVLALWRAYRFYQHDSAPHRQKVAAIARDSATVAIVALLGSLLIAYAKNNAARRGDYGTFSAPAQITEVIVRLTNSLWQTLTFQADQPFISLQAICLVLFGLYAAYWGYLNRSSLSARLSQWFYLFLANAVLGGFLLVCSFWVYRNNVNLRYFIVTYVTAWLSALLLSEALDRSRCKQAYALLLVAAFSASLSLPAHVFAVQRSQSAVEHLQEFQTLGEAGIIGDYWTAYLICSINPEQLDCTPYDRRGKTPCLPLGRKQKQVGRVRCERCAEAVLESPAIYLVKDQWLEAFPDQIQQFNRCLIRIGGPQTIASYTIAPYRRADAQP